MSEIPLYKLVPDYIKEFEAYIPSKPDDELKKIFNCDFLYRLNNNENPIGPPAEAKHIIKDFDASKAAVYPSGDCYQLRHKLADKFNMNPDQFIVGNGANEVIAFVIKAFCREGDNIITADKTFAVYEWIAKFSGFEAKLIPLINFTFDDQAILNSINERTKIIFICNPNNPTGTYWCKEKLDKFMASINSERIVVLDEAYCEYVEKDDFPDGIKLIEKYPNLVVFRTFSKMFGLAGLRIGYLAGNLEVVNIIRKTCVVYSVNTIAQIAAIKALEDEYHIQKTRELIRIGKEYLTKELDKLNLSYVCGEASYIMIKLPINDSLAYRKLMIKGIMVRTMTGFRFPNYIRVTISEKYMLEAFIDALKSIL